MGQVAFIMHLTKSKFEAMYKKQFATTYQKIRGKLINEKGAKLKMKIDIDMHARISAYQTQMIIQYTLQLTCDI